ncbi:hypothetical protein PGN35_007360 [Nodosilinea sp. PGN35]|uniref:hypothetical protein n=1 Tax=Nodosilinea sp. PGN35 TaxID=3020489 RepID=UPI0023B2CEB9|nr:hypothetical protein [Nodosilinea sp. TSF1-S3]MDF0367090.1 hypothetical protein [Nodosilinea sp. TSF1-S3]
MKTSYQDKLLSLWTVFLLGTLFHTQLGLMPLFHNQSIALEGAEGTEPIGWILWLMLMFFMVPLIAMLAVTFNRTYPLRKLHFWVTVLFSILNLAHLVADLLVQPIAWYQIALMSFLFLVGLVLNIVSFQWLREGRFHSLLAQGHPTGG